MEDSARKFQTIKTRCKSYDYDKNSRTSKNKTKRSNSQINIEGLKLNKSEDSSLLNEASMTTAGVPSSPKHIQKTILKDKNYLEKPVNVVVMEAMVKELIKESINTILTKRLVKNCDKSTADKQIKNFIEIQNEELKVASNTPTANSSTKKEREDSKDNILISEYTTKEETKQDLVNKSTTKNKQANYAIANTLSSKILRRHILKEISKLLLWIINRTINTLLPSSILTQMIDNATCKVAINGFLLKSISLKIYESLLKDLIKQTTTTHIKLESVCDKDEIGKEALSPMKVNVAIFNNMIAKEIRLLVSDVERANSQYKRITSMISNQIVRKLINNVTTTMTKEYATLKMSLIQVHVNNLRSCFDKVFLCPNNSIIRTLTNSVARSVLFRERVKVRLMDSMLNSVFKELLHDLFMSFIKQKQVTGTISKQIFDTLLEDVVKDMGNKSLEEKKMNKAIADAICLNMYNEVITNATLKLTERQIEVYKISSILFIDLYNDLLKRYLLYAKEITIGSYEDIEDIVVTNAIKTICYHCVSYRNSLLNTADSILLDISNKELIYNIKAIAYSQYFKRRAVFQVQEAINSVVAKKMLSELLKSAIDHKKSLMSITDHIITNFITKSTNEVSNEYIESNKIKGNIAEDVYDTILSSLIKKVINSSYNNSINMRSICKSINNEIQETVLNRIISKTINRSKADYELSLYIFNKTLNDYIKQIIMKSFKHNLFKEKISTILLDKYIKVLVSKVKDLRISAIINNESIASSIFSDMLIRNIKDYSKNLINSYEITLLEFDKMMRKEVKEVARETNQSNTISGILSTIILNTIEDSLNRKLITHCVRKKQENMDIAKEVCARSVNDVVILSLVEISQESIYVYTDSCLIFSDLLYSRAKELINSNMKLMNDGKLISTMIFSNLINGITIKLCKDALSYKSITSLLSKDIFHSRIENSKQLVSSIAFGQYTKRKIAYSLYEDIISDIIKYSLCYNSLSYSFFIKNISMTICNSIMSTAEKKLTKKIVTTLHSLESCKYSISTSILSSFSKRALKGLIISRSIKNSKINKGMSNAIFKGLIKLIITKLAWTCLNSYIQKRFLSSILFDSIYRKEALSVIEEASNEYVSTVEVVGESYVNELLHSVLKDFVIEFLIEYNEAVKALIARSVFNKLLRSVIASLVSRKDDYKLVLASCVYNELQKRVVKQVARAGYLNAKMACLELNSLIKENLRRCVKKIIQDNFVIASSIRDEILAKVVKRFVENKVVQEQAISSLRNSFISDVCYKEIKSLAETIRSDIIIDNEMSLEDLDDTPNIDISSRNIAFRSVSPGSSKHSKTHISSPLSDTKSPFTLYSFTEDKEVSGFDAINQELIKLSKEVQNDKILFTDLQCSPLCKELREIIMSTLKANWNIASLKRFELEVEKIFQIAELKNLQPILIKYCEHTIELIKKKIKIIQQSKVIEDIDDPEFVT